MWNRILSQYSSKLPKFNDKMLLGFRESKIDAIPDYLDELFKQSVHMLDKYLPPEKDRLGYVGYSELTPEERVTYIRSKNNFSKKFEIQPSNFKIIKFEFRFREESFFMHVDVPFLDDHALMVSGIDYYPQFALVEKGGMHRIDDEVLLQVMRAKLKFWRRDRETFVTTDGRTFREVNVTCKIHQKSSAKRKYPPLLVYSLATIGSFDKTMEFYLGKPGIIQLTTTPKEEKGYTYIEVKPDIFLKVTEEGLTDQAVRRVITSLVVIYRFHGKFSVKDLQDVYYYRVAVGKWTYPTVSDNELLYKNAVNHLNMNESMLDMSAKIQHRSIGIKADTMDELLRQAFHDIDKWISSYQGNNLYQKKLGALDQMMSGLVRSFNTKLFNSIINSKTGLTRENVNKLMMAGMYKSWISTSPMYRGRPIRYNDNYLLTIGAKRFRSTENDEMGGTKSTKSELPKSVLLAHPSQMVVESILCYPSSAPIESGSINPFLQIDDDGNVIPPEWAHEIETIFDG